MLTGFLARYAAACHCVNPADARSMGNVRSILVPALRRHLRELVQALRQEWTSARPLTREVRRALVLEALQCRTAIRAAVGVAAGEC